MSEAFLLVRPYYGVNVHSDAHGEFGTVLTGNEVYPDLPLISAATVLAGSEDHEVTVIDAESDKFPPDELLSKISKTPADKIIIKTSAATIKCDIELIRKIKESSPSRYVMIAGQAARPVIKWLASNTDIDEIIDEPLDLYIYRYVNGKNGTIDDLPTPDYTLADYRKYITEEGDIRLSVQASRGCMMGCKYCPYTQFYKSYETRSIDKVIEDLKSFESLGAKIVQFRDQFFTYDKKRVQDFCKRMIEEGINIKWTCETRLDSIDEETAELMKKAGLFMVLFGVETGDMDIIKEYNSNKGDLTFQKDTVRMLKDKGLLTMGFYIIGFPEDTWDSLQKTYQYAKDINSNIAVFNEYMNFDTSGIEDPSPDIYCGFSNTTNTDSTSILTRDEIRYAIGVFRENYTLEHDCLKKAYEFDHVLMAKYQAKVSELASCGTDLGEISRIIRES